MTVHSFLECLLNVTYCKDDRDASLSVHILLLRHYVRDLAHISDFDSLVIGISKSEK